MRTLVLCCLLSFASGCGALVDAGVRELFDDGPDPIYTHQSYWEHVEDASREEECSERTETVVIVQHRHH